MKVKTKVKKTVARPTPSKASEVLVTNKSSNMEKIFSSDMSYKAQIETVKSFNEDLSAGFGLGYKSEQLRYVSTGLNDSTSSRISVSAPIISLFSTYTF